MREVPTKDQNKLQKCVGVLLEDMSKKMGELKALNVIENKDEEIVKPMESQEKKFPVYEFD